METLRLVLPSRPTIRGFSLRVGPNTKTLLVAVLLIGLGGQTTLARKLPVPPPPRCSDLFPVTGLIWNEWMRIGGPASPIGCPDGKFKQDAPGGGGFQQFDHGQIAISPNVWPNGVVAAYQDGAGIIVDWTVSWNDPSPFNYDEFLVRWDWNGQHFDQGNNCSGYTGDGDQCNVIADMTGVQVALLHYYEDTHLRTKGTFPLNPDHGDGMYRIVVEGCDTHIIGSATCHQGWLHQVVVAYKTPPPDAAMYSLDLRQVPNATDVASSRANFFQRAAAVTLSNACQLLPYKVYKQENGYMTIILAKLAYFDFYQQDTCPGRPIDLRQEAFASLAQQDVESKTGTTVDSCPGCRTGEYDVALSGYIPMVTRFSSILPQNVTDHIINDLLIKRGPRDSGDETVDLAFPETENHLNLIESSQYITNDLLFAKTNDPQFDNQQNGLKAWWLKRLQKYLETDFIEYNARPYQTYTDRALENLASFAKDTRVHTAAKMVLDYISAKMAVSQNEARRVVPYRRKASYNSVNLLGWQSDAQSARSIILVGDLDILKQSQVHAQMAPLYGQDDMQWAITTSYQIPDLILDLLITPSHRVYYQALHHYADELYAGSPSYVISAGGHYDTFAYSVGPFGSSDDIGLALPTTVIPTGFFLARNSMIGFNGDPDDTKRSNMCVAPNFACGSNPVLPPSMTGVTPGCTVTNGNWTFVNFTSACRSGPNGLYAAVYQANDGVSFGFVEVFDAGVNPNVSFRRFRLAVLQNNQSRAFSSGHQNTYVTITGQEIRFDISPDSKIDSILNGPSPAQGLKMAHGSVMNSDFGSHVVTIANPYVGQQLVLDDHDEMNPVESTQAVTPYGADDCQPGFVWRGALPTDHVCVTPALRDVAMQQNAAGPSHRSPNGGPYGPDTCLQGYVWRDAFPNDHVCVVPDDRTEAAWDNMLAPSRRQRP